MSAYKSIEQTEGKYLVKDFRTFMDFIFTENAYLTKKNRHIAPKFLYPINQKMAYPQGNVTSGTKQPTYLQLHLFQHLAETAMLYELESGPNGNFNMIPTDSYEEFLSLTETEQYFTLLETLWVKIDWNVFMEYSATNLMINLSSMFSRLSELESGKKLDVTSPHEDNQTAHSVHNMDDFAAYLSYFGFWEIERNWETEKKPATKGKFIPKSITVTAFGKVMMQVLINHRPLVDWNQGDTGNARGTMDSILSILQDMQISEGMDLPELKKQPPKQEQDVSFIEPFIPLFPKGELQKTLSIEEKTRKDGVYTFKVTLRRGIWRKIELDSSHTLADLHMAIQDNFEFDRDHLYAFYMDGKKFSREAIHDEEAHEVEIGDLDLIEGQEFLYLFDFGAEWTFKVKLEQIDSERNLAEAFPVLIGGKGESPEQY